MVCCQRFFFKIPLPSQFSFFRRLWRPSFQGTLGDALLAELFPRARVVGEKEASAANLSFNAPACGKHRQARKSKVPKGSARQKPTLGTRRSLKALPCQQGPRTEKPIRRQNLDQAGAANGGSEPAGGGTHALLSGAAFVYPTFFGTLGCPTWSPPKSNF